MLNMRKQCGETLPVLLSDHLCDFTSTTQTARGANAPPKFFLPKNRFLATELKRGK